MAKEYSLKRDGEKRLSERFAVKEFSCQGSDLALIDEKLVAALEKMIERLKAKGGKISDGYRTAAYNKAIGGSANSRHLYGEAADICFFDEAKAPIPAETVCIEAEKHGLKGVEMINANWAHLDTRSQKWFAVQGARSASGARTYKTVDSFIKYFGEAGAVSPVLRLGGTGGSVKKMQEAIGAVPDGVFGKATEAALKAFQAGRGLSPDGVCGPKTWAEIDKKAIAQKN